MNIACWGYYGKNNIGDDLLLAELLKHLREYAADAEITVFSDQKIPYMSSLCKSMSICPRSTKELLRQSLVSDVLICGGGGLFAQRNTKKLVLWLVLALIMRVRRRSLVCVGLGIGHQNFEYMLDRMIWRMFIYLSRGVVVRQSGVAAALGIKNSHKLIEAADMVFGLDQTKITACEKETNSVVFALANVFGFEKNTDRHEFFDGMAEVINNCLEKQYVVHLIEFTSPQDRYLYDEILKRTNVPRGGVVYHEYLNNPYDVVSIFRQARFAVCMRFHSLVISAISQTPCCVLSYSDKIDDIVERLNLDKYAIQFSDDSGLYYKKENRFDLSQFKGVFESMIEDEDIIKKWLSEGSKQMQSLSVKNWGVLKDVIINQSLINKNGIKQ